MVASVPAQLPTRTLDPVLLKRGVPARRVMALFYSSMTASRTPSAAEASEYILELVASSPSIREAWLFGSRAAGSARPESDWDFLAFTDEATHGALG